MRQYYIADTRSRTRLMPTFNSVGKAIVRTATLNAREPGRYQCGDWVDRSEVGVNKPGEWEWVK